MNPIKLLGQSLQYLFGVVALGIGVLNLFWGNDPFFGLLITLLALLYFPPLLEFLERKWKFSFPAWLMILIALFTLWASFGVGELADKIQMMRQDLGF